MVGVGVLMSSGCASRKAASSPPSPPTPIAAPKPLPEALATFDQVWSQIHEHHFDTNYNGWSWEAVRREFLPKAMAAESNAGLRDVLREMVGRLGQSHLTIIPGESGLGEADEGGGVANPGFQIRLTTDSKLMCVTSVRAGSPAAEAGVRVGWELKRIDGRPVAPMLEAFPKEGKFPQTAFLAWRQLERRLGGGAGSVVSVEFQDTEGGVHTIGLRRVEPPGAKVQFSHLPPLRADLSQTNLTTLEGRRVGLIRFNIWMVPTAVAFDRALDDLRGSDGIIIDLRGNIGGLAGMPMGVAGHFLNETKLLGTLVTRDNRLEFRANPRLVNPDNRRVTPYAGPLAILVDEISVSASEMFAGTMRENGRARIFGLRTTGQAVPAVMESLPNGDIFYHPIADFVTAGGHRLEAAGVLPDVEVSRLRRDLAEGRDPALEAALGWMDSRGGARN